MVDSAVAAAVGAATGLQNAMAVQEKENTLLRKVLDNQSNTILSLVESVSTAPKLASVGSVGTQVHVTA